MKGRLPGVLWLTLVWVLLWGSVTPLVVVGGIVVAVLVTALFRLPVPTERLPVRPLRLLALAAYVVRDLVGSALQVGGQVLRRGPDARGAIVAVPLAGAPDRVLAVMVDALSLSPGTMVVQIDPARDVGYVYALGPRDPAGVERARRRVLGMQRRVLAALGTPEQLAELDRRAAP